MTNIIVDANIIISALIKKNSAIRDHLLNENINFFSPDFVLQEIDRHRNKIAKYSELTEEEMIFSLHAIFKNIVFFRDGLIKKANIKSAYHLCKEFDAKDTLYVALTLELDGLLWTGDKKLIDGLDSKDFKKTISSDKLFLLFTL